MKIKGHNECMRHAERHEVLNAAWSDHAHICDLYFNQRAPNGRPYSIEMIAREYRISPGTAEKIIRLAVNQPEGNLLQEQLGYEENVPTPKVIGGEDTSEVV